MRIFLIDTENVHHHGLDGIEKLDDTDLIYVLSTPTFKKEKIEGDLKNLLPVVLKQSYLR